MTSVRGEWVTFGESEPNESEPPLDAAASLGAPAQNGASRADHYYRLEASYAYRPLRFVNEFGVRLGLVRGSSPRAAGDASSYSLGGGAELTLGDPYGASLDLGAERIEGFGSRLFTRLNIVASESVRLSPMIEATDMPNARNYGVRLLGELCWQVTPELDLSLRGGYQARAAVSGGVSVGAGASLGF